MTQDQLMGLFRALLAVLGTLATTFGWIAPDKVQSLTANILAAIGPISLVVSTVWSVIANSKSSIVASASAMPEVNSAKLMSAINDPALKAAAQANATDKDGVPKDNG